MVLTGRMLKKCFSHRCVDSGDEGIIKFVGTCENISYVNRSGKPLFEHMQKLDVSSSEKEGEE